MDSNWIILGLLVVLLVAFIFMSISRKKKEDAFRKDLETKMVPGAKVKTYSGLYGTIISITDTTDGKIVLLETGEGKNVSYQSLHINAIYGLDTKQPVRYDAQGNVILPEEPKTEDKAEEKTEEVVAPAKKSRSKKAIKEQPTETETPVEVKEEPVVEIEEKPVEKKSATKKTTKKTTTDKK